MAINIVDTHGLDLANMEWADAVREGRSRCPLTNAEIAVKFSAELGLKKPYPMTTVQRWFNSNDRKYWPSAEYVPTLCRVLGNYILVAWMLAQASKDPEEGQVITMADLQAFLPAIVAEFGKIGSALALVDAASDITPMQAKGIRGAVSGMLSMLQALMRLLNPLAARKSRRERLCA